MNLKNLRKDATLGLILLALWLIIKVIFRGGGLFLWILGIVGLAFLVIGILPNDLHAKVTGKINELLKKTKK